MSGVNEPPGIADSSGAHIRVLRRELRRQRRVLRRLSSISFVSWKFARQAQHAFGLCCAGAHRPPFGAGSAPASWGTMCRCTARAAQHD